MPILLVLVFLIVIRLLQSIGEDHEQDWEGGTSPFGI
jgi:hypothetical protein